MSAEALTARAIEILATLVGFDTTSRLSNLELVEFVEEYLARHGVAARRVPNADGTKSNLMAVIGPRVDGGVVLSGHTDVVPVDGQAWASDPFRLEERDGRLYGRGTCDMKGFLALALAAVPDILAAGPQRPVHLAFSYDEEVGCIGAPDMIEVIAREAPRPAMVVVGEPTSMEAVIGHKGIATYRVVVEGKEAHSSQPHLGVSAVMAAAPLMGDLVKMSERFACEADPASLFEPKGATLTIGQVNGGTAPNILAGRCEFCFDLRYPPGFDRDAAVAPVVQAVAALDAALKGRAAKAGATLVRRSAAPPLAPEPGGPAETLARRLAGDNGPPRVVAYAAEAGQFQAAGFSTVICGPGSIDQAHQPDEYVSLEQMQRGASFMRRLAEWSAAGA